MDLSELERLTTKQNEVSDVLRRARALVDAPDSWCKGNSSIAPGTACIGYAMNLATNSDIPLWQSAEHVFCLANGIPTIPFQIPLWNDAPERTHAEVLDAFTRAIELAERGQ